MSAPDPGGAAFWREAAAAASADPAFKGFAGHLRGLAFRVAVGPGAWVLRIDRGALELADRNAQPAFTISGPPDEWARLVAGEIVYGQATNITLGKLRISGDPLAATWCVRPLWRLWRLTADLAARGAAHD